MEINQLFEEFIKQVRIEGKARATIKNYRDSFEELKAFRPGLTLADLTPETMVEYLTYRNERERQVGNQRVVRDLKNSSIATIRGKLGSFFEWLVSRGHLETNPFNDIAYPNVDYSDKRAFTKAQIDKLYLAVSRDIKWDTEFLRLRNLTMIMFLALTGVRKGEFLGLRVADVDMEQRHITIRGETSKSKRTRILSINPQLYPYLDEYLKARLDYDTPALWVSNNQDRNFTADGMKHLIDKLSSLVGFNCHLHRFRHTYAVNFYITNHDIKGVMDTLGHKSLKQTLQYLRSVPQDETLKAMNSMSIEKFR